MYSKRPEEEGSAAAEVRELARGADASSGAQLQEPAGFGGPGRVATGASPHLAKIQSSPRKCNLRSENACFAANMYFRNET